MGYIGNEYYVAEDHEFDFINLVFAYIFFFSKKQFLNGHITSDIKKDFEDIYCKSLKREIKIPRNPKIHEFEKLRLNFYSKEAVFNYLMKNLIDYDMIPEDK